MTPWLRAQRTFERISIIIRCRLCSDMFYTLMFCTLHRNELYNAQGAMTDEPRRLDFICAGGCGPDWGGALFAELEVCILHLIIVTVSFPAGPVW